MRDGMGKWLLRRWLEKNCPAARPFAPEAGLHRADRRSGSAARARGSARWSRPSPASLEIADRERVIALFRAADGRRRGFAAWILLFYALWHRTHILGLPPSGDVFEILSTV